MLSFQIAGSRHFKCSAKNALIEKQSRRRYGAPEGAGVDDFKERNDVQNDRVI